MAAMVARPAAAEVRTMLQKIKLDNMERGRRFQLAGSLSSPSYMYSNHQQQQQSSAALRFEQYDT